MRTTASSMSTVPGLVLWTGPILTSTQRLPTPPRRPRARTRIGYEHADRLLTYPQANYLSASRQPIRERRPGPHRHLRATGQAPKGSQHTDVLKPSTTSTTNSHKHPFQAKWTALWDKNTTPPITTSNPQTPGPQNQTRPQSPRKTLHISAARPLPCAAGRRPGTIFTKRSSTRQEAYPVQWPEVSKVDRRPSMFRVPVAMAPLAGSM